MNKVKHPKHEIIKKYIWQILPEHEAINVGEHLADCQDCAAFAQKEARIYYLWENWQAETHGELYWKNQVHEVLTRSYTGATSFYRKERLKRWLDEWKGKLGSMLQFVSRKSEEVLNVVTKFPEELFLPRSKFQFAPVTPVRGKELDATNLKLAAGRDNKIQVVMDKSSGNVNVKIPKGEYEPPLLILMPREGEPRVILAEDVEGTNFYLAVFKDVPQDGFCLLFEPLPEV